MNVRSIVSHVVKKRTKDKPGLTAYHIDYFSTLRRVKTILKYSSKNSNVLFVGDDDLISVILSLIGYSNIAVIDLDEELLGIISSTSRNKVKAIKFDLKKVYKNKYPPLKSNFDIFVTDPPYSEDGLRIFPAVGIKYLKINGIGMIVSPSKKIPNVSVRDPDKLTYLLENFLLKNGMIIIDIIPDSQISYHGTISSLRVVRKIRNTKIYFDHLYGMNQFY